MGCSACPGGSGRDADAGRYVRCLQAAEPAEARSAVGDLSIETQGRLITVTSARPALRLAVFSGPAPGPVGAAGTQLGSHGIDAALCLGGVGDDLPAISETLETLAQQSFATFVLPGGRDDLGRLSSAWDRLPEQGKERIFLLTGVHRVRFAGHEFVVVPGAPDGRYARVSEACGFSSGELERFAATLGPVPDGIRRGLWAWMAPGGGGPFAVGRTHLGLDVGSRPLADFATKIGAKSGLFGWPAVRAAQPAAVDGQVAVGLAEAQGALRLVPPRLGELPLERSDGSRVPPGFVIVEVGAAGIGLVGRVELKPNANAH